jgi:SEC-C motif
MEPYRRNSPKIGRNDLCPCGSGLKFKRCHYNPRFELPFLVHQARVERSIQEEATRLLEQKKAEEIQRQKQQGHGRPIISVEHLGYRFVAVGNRLYYSKKWKTFTDFLGGYLATTLGGEWGNEELKKQFEERHPIIQWYHHICVWQRKHIEEPGKIYSAPVTGAVSAYYGLAYNLYLIAHNVHDVQTRLVDRLRNPANFHGAFYETRVAAELVKAGFELEYEDEGNKSRTHCEFTATFSQTKKKFSVEAKSRPIALETVSGKRLRIGRQLYGALEKRADFDRLVFIDINRSMGATKEEVMKGFDRAVKIIRRSENMLISGQPTAPAYVFLTNFPDQYCLDDSTFFGAVAFLGYKIPDFGEGAKFASIRDAVRAREQHVEMFELKKSMAEHAVLPSTFDGQMPSVAFGPTEIPRLAIGKQYLVPDSTGREVPGVLVDAVVNVPEQQVYGIYGLDSGAQIIATCPITIGELEDYRRHPDTFFGVYKKQGRKIDDPVELFDFFYDSYKETPKERLLEFIKDAPDLEHFQKLSQKDLAEAVCERWVYNIIQQRENRRTT